MESIPEKKTPILVVDDDVGLLLSIKATLISKGIPEPALVSDSQRVIDLVRKHRFQVVLLDLVMPQTTGMEVLQQLKKEFPTIECIIVTAYDDVSSAVQTMKFGAYDYLVKPLDSEKLVIVIDHALERYHLRKGLTLFESSQTFSALKHPDTFKEMVSEDESMALVFHQAETFAENDYNLLITGETGVGKDILSRIIHRLSPRSYGPFSAVNMAALSKTLFEDELFGHMKGAYTGATASREGFFEATQGGTIYLDEITALDSELQGKLLRVIQERELYRLGSSEARHFDVRIISATNLDIKEEIEEGRFRTDLFYRLNVCHINIPPLRGRKKDILPLARHFLKIHAEKNQKKIDSLSPETADCLIQYSYPGNVRELENIIAASTLTEKEETLTLSSIPGFISSFASSPSHPYGLSTLADLEKEHIHHVLESTNGNRTQAARILGIALRTLQRKLKAFSTPKSATE